MPESRLGVRRLFYRVGQGKAEECDAFGVTSILQDFPRKVWRASVSGICYNNLFASNAGHARVPAVGCGALWLIMRLIASTDSACR